MREGESVPGSEARQRIRFAAEVCKCRSFDIDRRLCRAHAAVFLGALAAAARQTRPDEEQHDCQTIRLHHD
jgi:hypothetical protein